MKKPILLTICVCLTIFIFAQSAETASKEPGKSLLNKEQLAATWNAGNITYVFDKSGASLVTIGDRTCPAAWVLDGNKLTISPKKLMWKKGDPCSETKVLEVKSLTGNSLEVFEPVGNKELHLTKQK